MSKLLTLKKNFEFSRVYQRGKYYVGRKMTMYSHKNRCEETRFGISASKKVGKAVQRNRIRRLIKENICQYQDSISPGYDIVIVVRKNDDLPTFNEIKKEMKFLLKKLKVLDVKND